MVGRSIDELGCMCVRSWTLLRAKTRRELLSDYGIPDGEHEPGNIVGLIKLETAFSMKVCPVGVKVGWNMPSPMKLHTYIRSYVNK